MLAKIYVRLEIHTGDSNEMSGVNLVYEKQWVSVKRLGLVYDFLEKFIRGNIFLVFCGVIKTRNIKK